MIVLLVKNAWKWKASHRPRFLVIIWGHCISFISQTPCLSTHAYVHKQSFSKKTWHQSTDTLWPPEAWSRKEKMDRPTLMKTEGAWNDIPCCWFWWLSEHLPNYTLELVTITLLNTLSIAITTTDTVRYRNCHILF